MRRFVILSGGILILSLLMSACGPPATPAPTPLPIAAPTPATPVLGGRLTVYTSIQPALLEQIEPAVKRNLPGVEVAFFQAGTEKLIAKLAAEMEAGKVGADVLMVADPAYYIFLKSKGMLLPYKSPNATGILGFQDPDGYFASVRIINGVIGYNTKLVKKKEAPTRFSDLKDPKWKGKVGMPDPTLSGSAFGTVAALVGKYGWDYFKALKDNGVFIADGQGSLQQKLVSGQVAVAIILETNILMAKSKGDPVGLVYPEDGVAVLPSPIGVIKTTANPDAAKAMVDWWFTQEGQTAGFQVIMAYDGLQALQQVEKRHPDLVILDAMMPGMDGFEVCRRVRSETTIPVLLLTVKDEQEDVIKGLELGADDYMTKPFSTRELVLRVQAILRRTRIRQVAVIESGPLRIDFERHHVTLHGLPVELSPLEYRLLACLAANAGRVLTWQALLKEVWEIELWQGSREMVKVQIHRLRQKLEPNPAKPSLIHTVRGAGYSFETEEPNNHLAAL